MIYILRFMRVKCNDTNPDVFSLCHHMHSMTILNMHTDTTAANRIRSHSILAGSACTKFISFRTFFFFLAEHSMRIGRSIHDVHFAVCTSAVACIKFNSNSFFFFFTFKILNSIDCNTFVINYSVSIPHFLSWFLVDCQFRAHTIRIEVNRCT